MDDAPEKPAVADIQALLDSRGPTEERARVLDLTWSSRFRVHHRLVRSYRKDRLFLMGDAAHVHSPAGGQGMNTGIIDAVVLGQLLGDVVNGVRPEAELDLYETLRRPAAQEVLELAGRMTEMALTRNPVKRFVRNLALSVLNLNPFAEASHRLEIVRPQPGTTCPAAGTFKQAGVQSPSSLKPSQG